jgi:hypothetical protein
MIAERILCPCCERDIPLAEKEIEIISNRLGRKVRAMTLCYECDICEQSFTTTESDTESMRRIGVIINREIRKEKISKL